MIEGRKPVRREPSSFHRHRESRAACPPAMRTVLFDLGRSGPPASLVDAGLVHHLVLRPRRLALQAPAATTACGVSPREATADTGSALRSDPDTRAIYGSARDTELHPVPTK